MLMCVLKRNNLITKVVAYKNIKLLFTYDESHKIETTIP